ncbi:MAG: hypothetical protein ACI8P2_004811, partial [Candidatus Latescibacterota bacterium]
MVDISGCFCDIYTLYILLCDAKQRERWEHAPNTGGQ